MQLAQRTRRRFSWADSAELEEIMPEKTRWRERLHSRFATYDPDSRRACIIADIKANVVLSARNPFLPDPTVHPYPPYFSPFATPTWRRSKIRLFVCHFPRIKRTREVRFQPCHDVQICMPWGTRLRLRFFLSLSLSIFLSQKAIENQN